MTYSWRQVTTGVYLVSGLMSGCSSSNSGSSDGGGAGSGQPSSSGQSGPTGGSLLLACSNPYGASAGSVSPSCIDYYAQSGAEFSTLQSTYKAICTAGGGTILSSPCPSAASAGGCRIGPAASDPYAEYSVEIFYSPPATVASVQANCASQGDPYDAPGGGTVGRTTDSGAASGSSGGGSGSGSSSGTASSSSGAGSSGDTCCQLAPNGSCYCVYTDGGPCMASNLELTIVSSCSPSACCAANPPASDDAGPAAGATLCSCADSTYINGGGWTCGSWLSEIATGATTLTSSCP
jgi:hypothetical protein